MVIISYIKKLQNADIIPALHHLLPKKIEYFKKLGIKNFIVLHKENNDMYNIPAYQDFLRSNHEKILQIILQDNGFPPHVPSQMLKDNDNIFSSTQTLFTNFMKWCCRP